MKKTLQDQYLLIKEGKGHKGVFLTEAKREFPYIVRNAATFDEAVASLKTKNIISENVISVMPAIMDRPKKESYETAFEAFLAEAKKKNDDEKVKAEEKKVSKPVEEDLDHAFDYKDDKNPDNMIFDQIMTGYYAEMKDPKNADKTMQQLKDIVFKNLAKDPIYYTKDGQFGIKDLGYVTEAPGLGEPKEAKGKYKSSGYGDLKESKETEEDLKSKLIQMGVSPMVVDSIAKTKGIEGLKDRLKEKLKEGEDKFTSNIKNAVTKKKDSKFTDEEIKAKLKQKREAELKRRKEAGESLEELAIRKAIQEMIDAELEEAYQMPSVNTSGRGGEGGRRFIPNQLPFPQNIRKRFGEHIVFNPGSGTLYISDILYNNLVKGYANQPAIKKLIMDIPPMVKQVLNKPDNYGPTTELPKEFRVYHPLNVEVEKAKADQFNKAGDKQYWAEGDFLIPNLNIMEEDSMEPLRESVEKDLADINKEAEHEVLQAKLDKIDALIDHRRSKLSKLDEDEDMKALTDKKKVKELEKDIKKLEVARKKVEKMMSKFKGKKAASKEVIDEVEDDEELPLETPAEASAEYLQYKEDAENRYDAGESIDSILDNYNNISQDMKDMLRNDLEGKMDGMDY